MIEENNIEALCEQILDSAMFIMDSQFSSIQILDKKAEELCLLGWRNFHPESAKYWQTVSIKTGTSCGAALQHGERIIVLDVEVADFLQNTESLRHYRLSGISSVQSTPLTSRSGQVLGMISTHWREQHEPNEYVLALFDVLARQMADVLERQYSLEALKEADRRKDEFLAVLGHELRNPLFPVKNALYLLQQEQLLPDHLDLIQIMERQVDHMVHLVDDLLEISRITTGKIELQRETINLMNVINNAIEANQPLLDSKQLQVKLSAPPGSLMIHADKVRITQVFANLLNNAAKFTFEKGIININISLTNHMFVVSVSDNGIGISKEMLPKIFDIFVQGQHSMDALNSGLGIGLGLAMVRSLMELHGGTVEAFSAGHNLGSEFILSIPFIEKKSSETIKNRLKINPSFANLRILIVDDNPDISDSLAKLLRYWKISVQAFSNGQSALEALDVFNPHIIFLDIGMPEMNGYKVAEKIRQNSRYASIKLVALTGWNQETDRIKSKASGFNEHLGKPVHVNDLCDLLNKLVLLP